MGHGRYTPCPGCGYFIEWNDEQHHPACPLRHTLGSPGCGGSCIHESYCSELRECWESGIRDKLLRHGELSTLHHLEVGPGETPEGWSYYPRGVYW